MWDWDFAPAWHSYKKPISKRELEKLKKAYSEADSISKKSRAMEEEEQKKANIEIDDLLEGID